MTADDDSCSSYDSVSATHLTVDPTKPATDSVTSSYNLDISSHQQLQIGRDVLWYLLWIYNMKSSVHPTIMPTSP